MTFCKYPPEVLHLCVTHSKIAPSQARLTVEFLWNELPKTRVGLWGNWCIDFLTKFEASSDVDLLIHASFPTGLLNLLRSNAIRTFFLRD
ncbi:hypothetical protein MTR_7g107320 [Medicago truncatula]|uniref:Uncharacterized protein n=1 Tax=Medicago truncatula TaxID=3880 RepID=G8A1A8_MEDTR|nr:hypothetical protein MTR_7g107320 [Medicago truncatula]